MGSQDTITLTGSATGDTPAGQVTIPCELGPVRLVREIGRGGMGVVYLGRHQMLDRDVAVKFLLNAVAGPDDPGFARFLEGARAAARLEHPGLTTIHHADVVDGIPYLVMQYVDGPALSGVLKQTGPLSLSASFAVLDAVSEAIGELHDRGIIHRDIKAGNVMLGLDGRVVVTDFGLALARPMGQRGPSSARLGGTPAYMAPEMFAGELSLQSDVYALGIMTFELVTGELPYTGTLEEVREKHLHEPLPLEPLQRRGLDPAMIEVLERATRKNAMFRYKTARHFRSALKPAIMTDELLREGVAELHNLVSRALDTEPDATTTEAAETTPTTTYFDRLSEIAGEKRATREPADKADVEGSAPEDRDQRRLTDDLLCIRCGYSLRGLAPATRCPECGTPIDRSLRGDALAAADPAWLSRVHRGVILVTVACVVGITVTVASLMEGGCKAAYEGSYDAAPWTGGPAPVPLAVKTIDRFGEAAMMPCAVLLLLGVVGLTKLDPRLALNVQPIGLRRIARVGAAAAILVLPLSYAFSGLTGHALVAVGGKWAFRSALVGCLFSTALYLARLAERIPDPTLAGKTRSFGRRYAVCAAILLIGEAVDELCGWMPGLRPSGLALVPVVIVMIFVLAWAYYSLRLMRLAFTYAGVLKRCLVEARKRDRGQQQAV